MSNNDSPNPVEAPADLDSSDTPPASVSTGPSNDPAYIELQKRMETLQAAFLEGAEKVKAAHEEFMVAVQTVMAQVEAEERATPPGKTDGEG